MTDSSQYLKMEYDIIAECDKTAEEVTIPNGVAVY